LLPSSFFFCKKKKRTRKKGKEKKMKGKAKTLQTGFFSHVADRDSKITDSQAFDSRDW
jgi:hypothetical protein